MVTLVPAAALADVLASDDELDDEDELEDDDCVEVLSPDEQPARPATTIAAPPTATSKLCFTTVLPMVLATRQDQRIVQGSMECH
jgi:hypothetical protein